MRKHYLALAVTLALAIVFISSFAAGQRSDSTVLKGAAAFGDWRTDKPGVRRHLTPQDLPAPTTNTSTQNFPDPAPMPAGAKPQVPAGFSAELVASGLKNARVIRTAPNGDLFVAESKGRFASFDPEAGPRSRRPARSS